MKLRLWLDSNEEFSIASLAVKDALGTQKSTLVPIQLSVPGEGEQYANNNFAINYIYYYLTTFTSLIKKPELVLLSNRL